MAQEPQSVPPRPLRLQADYLRLRAEQKAAREQVKAGSDDKSNQLAEKDQTVLDYIRAYKESLNG